MRKVQYLSYNGAEFLSFLLIMESSANKPVLVYTVHKAASMFLHRLTQEIAQDLEMNHYSINNPATNSQVSAYAEITASSWREYIKKNVTNSQKRACFGPIRLGEAVPSIPDDLSNYSVLLHLRDPRDVLTSLFFSHTFSHPRDPAVFNPGDDTRQRWIEQGIDAFVIERSDRFLNRYEYGIKNLLGNQNVKLLKYEVMALNFESWLQQFLSAFVAPEPALNRLTQPGGIAALVSSFWGGQAPKTLFDELYKKLYAAHKSEFDVEDEDIYRHKRQVLPGDHQRKLKPETITFLNEKFAAVLEALEYS